MGLRDFWGLLSCVLRLEETDHVDMVYSQSRNALPRENLLASGAGAGTAIWQTSIGPFSGDVAKAADVGEWKTRRREWLCQTKAVRASKNCFLSSAYLM